MLGGGIAVMWVLVIPRMPSIRTRSSIRIRFCRGSESCSFRFSSDSLERFLGGVDGVDVRAVEGGIAAVMWVLVIPRMPSIRTRSSIRMRFCCGRDSCSSRFSSGSLERFLGVVDGVDARGVDEADGTCGSVEQVAAVCEDEVPPALVPILEMMWTDLAATCVSSLMALGLPRSSTSRSSAPKLSWRRPSPWFLDSARGPIWSSSADSRNGPAFSCRESARGLKVSPCPDSSVCRMSSWSVDPPEEPTSMLSFESKLPEFLSLAFQRGRSECSWLDPSKESTLWSTDSFLGPTEHGLSNDSGDTTNSSVFESNDKHGKLNLPPRPEKPWL